MTRHDQCAARAIELELDEPHFARDFFAVDIAEPRPAGLLRHALDMSEIGGLQRLEELLNLSAGESDVLGTQELARAPSTAVADPRSAVCAAARSYRGTVRGPAITFSLVEA